MTVGIFYALPAFQLVFAEQLVCTLSSWVLFKLLHFIAPSVNMDSVIIVHSRGLYTKYRT